MKVKLLKKLRKKFWINKVNKANSEIFELGTPDRLYTYNILSNALTDYYIYLLLYARKHYARKYYTKIR